MQSPHFAALREAVRLRISPPNHECVAEIACDTGSTPQTIYNWRSQWQKQGQQVLIRYGGRIVAEHRRQRPGSRCRQVIDGHWEGLVPQRQRREAARSLQDASARGDGEQELRVVRSSELARPLAVDAELIGEVAA